MWRILLGLGLALVAFAKRAGATPAELPPTTPGGTRLHPSVVLRVLDWRTVVEQETDGLEKVNVPLVLAIIARETGGDPRQGPDGEQGLMQVSQAALQDYNQETGNLLLWPSDMTNPQLNVRVGSWFLNRKIREMGDLYHGIRAYNCGAAGARRNPTCGAAYAEHVLNVGLPSFRAVV